MFVVTKLAQDVTVLSGEQSAATSSETSSKPLQYIFEAHDWHVGSTWHPKPGKPHGCTTREMLHSTW